MWWARSTLLLAAALAGGCSVVVDTSGLTGGTRPDVDGAIVDEGTDGRGDATTTDSSINDAGTDAANDGKSDVLTDATIDSTTSDSTADTKPPADTAPDSIVADGSIVCPTGMVSVPAPAGKASYCIDQTEVTADAYQTWLAATPSLSLQPAECAWNTTYEPNVTTGYPSGWWPPDSTHGSYPIRWVNWCDAYTYCKGNGKHLCGAYGGGRINLTDYADPSRSQWMNACSKDGAQTYSFGNTDDGHTCAEKPTWSYPVAGGSLAGCVGGYPGIYDLSGNLEEWEDNCVTPLTGAGPSDECHTRGGSYGSTDISCGNPQIYARDTQVMWVGFRCCKD